MKTSAVEKLEKEEKQARESKENQEILASLVESQQFGPAIKTVRNRGWEGKYQGYLKKNTEIKNKQIKEICKDHYEEFIGSIDSLLTVKQDVQELKGLITELNNDVQSSGKVMISQAEKLMDFRYIRHNIADTLAMFEECQYMVDLFVKVGDQISHNKFFPALKTIDQLQRLRLPQFEDFQFAKLLEDQLPLMTLQIKEAVKKEFDQWLVGVQKRAKELGALAMTRMDAQMQSTVEKEDANRRARENSLAFGDVDANLDNFDPNLALTLMEEKWDEEGLFEAVDVSFGPVYRGFHIYDHLNLGEEFQMLYKENRRTQAQQAVDLSDLTEEGGGFLDNCTAYFSNLAGFFVIEDSVLKAGNDLVTRNEMESLWEMAVSKIKVVLREQLELVTDPSLFLHVKYTVLLFCNTLDSYGVPTASLLQFVRQLLPVFENMLFKHFKTEVRDIFEHDKHLSMVVEDENEYEEFVLGYGLCEPSMNVEFPANMPFSLIVPQVCASIKAFIAHYKQFADYMEHDDKVALMNGLAPAVDRLFLEVNERLAGLIDKLSDKILIAQAVQISINANTFIKAIHHFELDLTTLVVREGKARHGSGGDGGDGGGGGGDDNEDSNNNNNNNNNNVQFLTTPSLCTSSLFTSTQSRCETMLFELMSDKIEGFLELMQDIDWLTTNLQDDASGYIQDIRRYLETTFIILHHLPDAVKDALHYFICKHISSSLMMALRDCKHFNIVSIANLDKDVCWMERFAENCGVDGLPETFSEIRQFVDLLLLTNGDPSVILDAKTRQEQFPALDNSKLVDVLGKFKDLGMFTSHPRGVPKVKKKQVEALVKQLRLQG